MARTLPKYQRILERLRRNIESGSWTPGTRLPPERELFRSLRASDRTVLRALAELAREGLIVRRRGSGTFVADRACPPLMPGRHLRLGLLWYQSVVPQYFGKTFPAEMTRGALAEWGAERIEPVFSADAKAETTLARWEDPARGLTIECVGEAWGGRDRSPPLKAIREAGYDGLVTLGIIEESFLDKLLGLNVPSVIVDFPTQVFGDRADLVYADPQLGYRAAVEQFFARGMKRIHFVGALVWDPHGKAKPEADKRFTTAKRIDPDSFLMLSAWRQAMDACGVEVPDGWIHFFVTDEAMRMDYARALAELPADQRPQAVVCHDVRAAEHLLEDCARLGLELEGAGACTGPHYGRALGIRLDPQAMGAMAAEALLARLRKPNRPYLNVGVRMAAPAVPAARKLPVPAGQAI